MKKDKLGAFIDAVYAITITICIINLKKPETMSWAGLWAVRDSLVAYTLTFFMMISMWVQIHALWEQIERVDNSVIWSSMIFLFSSSFIPYATSILMESNFSNRSFSVLYGLLTIFISFNLLVIQRCMERCNKDVLGVGRGGKIVPNKQIMFVDMLIKVVSTLISVFVWPPFILIGVWLAFEFNSLATRILQKRIQTNTLHARKVVEE